MLSDGPVSRPMSTVGLHPAARAPDLLSLDYVAIQGVCLALACASPQLAGPSRGLTPQALVAGFHPFCSYGSAMRSRLLAPANGQEAVFIGSVRVFPRVRRF